MAHSIEKVRQYYDENAAEEWARMERHPIEFALNSRFIARYVQPCDRVLDIGGGPGRYALWLAERGCNVVLADLSEGNIAYAKAKALELGLTIRAEQANALNLSHYEAESFDHVLLMGPLYHLTERADRITAVNEALRVLRPGGTLHASFISSYGGIIWSMKCEPHQILNPELTSNFELFVRDEEFTGDSFTSTHFIRQQDVLPFMAQFPLEKLHFFASEGIMAPCEASFLSQPKEIYDAWIDLSERVCERENLLSFAEHFQYVGRKKQDG